MLSQERSCLPIWLYGAVDGTGLTMTAKEAEGRDGKGEEGRPAPASSSSASSPR